MRISDEQERRTSFSKILMELAKSQELLKDNKAKSRIYKELENIYYKCNKDNFRHFYSDIFAILTIIDGDSELGSLDVLAQNIAAIKAGYSPLNKDKNDNIIDISKEINKLYDHTNLDIARINYTKTMTNNTISEIQKCKNLISELQTKIKDEEKRNNKVEADLKKNQSDMQKQYITILGIFASIVIAFTGAIAFSSSVLNNIHKSSCYKIGVISLIIGIVFFNLVWCLLDFIRSINGEIERKWVYWIAIPDVRLSY